jgi:hypothetical protein
MKEKFSRSVGPLAHDPVKTCPEISNATRNVWLDVSVLMVNFLMTRIAASLLRSVVANMKGRRFNQEKVSVLEIVKLGMSF